MSNLRWLTLLLLICCSCTEPKEGPTITRVSTEQPPSLPAWVDTSLLDGPSAIADQTATSSANLETNLRCTIIRFTTDQALAKATGSLGLDARPGSASYLVDKQAIASLKSQRINVDGLETCHLPALTMRQDQAASTAITLQSEGQDLQRGAFFITRIQKLSPTSVDLQLSIQATRLQTTGDDKPIRINDATTLTPGQCWVATQINHNEPPAMVIVSPTWIKKNTSDQAVAVSGAPSKQRNLH